MVNCIFNGASLSRTISLCLVFSAFGRLLIGLILFWQIAKEALYNNPLGSGLDNDCELCFRYRLPQ